MNHSEFVTRFIDLEEREKRGLLFKEGSVENIRLFLHTLLAQPPLPAAAEGGPH